MTFRVCAIAMFVFLATFSLSSLSQQRPIKVLVLYDMEGVSGATHWRQTNFRHPTEYAEGRRSLTADVNAAISGLRAAGATEILVVDGHGSQNDGAPDVLEDQLLSPAKHLYRDTEFDEYVGSYDQDIYRAYD